MSIRVALHHQTTYQFDRPVQLSPHVVRLRPAPHCRTPILSHSLRVRPEKQFFNWQQDVQGNFLARLVFLEMTRQLEIEVDLVAELTVINPFDFFMESGYEQFPFQYDAAHRVQLAPCLETEPMGPRLTAWLESIDRTPRTTIDFLVELNARLEREIRYLIRLEPGIQTCEETLERGSGSCRDSAWLLVQILRHLGLGARFVSGYLIQLVPDVKPLEGPAGAERDFTDLHAWTEVFVPGAGWIGLDPTSGLLAAEGHIPLASTPDPASAAPITGAVDRCETAFHFQMSVTRIHEDPRVTKPYTEEQWQEIMAVGHEVDRRLTAGDVRLTIGGEPTFVSIDDMEGDEWNTTALGPTKRALAADLLARLQARFAPGALLHFGQGKWYPGESLPRWALSCYWRTDGEPLWLDHRWIADDRRPYDFTARDAERFTKRLAERLEVGARWVAPAYEDPLYYMWREQRLPPNVDPLDSRIKDPEERTRLARVFERGLGEVSGYVLPLTRQWWQGQARWTSGPWPVRSGKMFLLPGDSPVGLRLPLEALPWIEPGRQPTTYPLDPLADRPPLGPYPGHLPQPNIRATPLSDSEREGGRQRIHPQVLADGTSSEIAADGVVRTALCVEPRGGRLCVFLPPTSRLEDFVDLIATVEQTAADLETPVVIEGYPPPADYRLNVIKVTPDPGVLEVNVHPAHNWDELVELTTTVYEEARLARLGTEKFDLDGRHTGTGGGNHVVLGGPTPADSPFLRRPDVLRSLLAYWNNHPALSYVFSGSFVGPTSQAPRVDEGRRDALYELEIAFQQIPDGGGCPPWLVDRVFRHLLVDVTGNTHRAEFCIDKLYSPDTSSGRLGLIEFRAFEMPPHARMSLTQQLLLRALVCRFWEAPFKAKLVSWQTALHDRFLLPHFLESDLEDVLDELRQCGFPFELEWFAPHLEFRFPRIGRIVQRGIDVELRQAIEPWYVLGEEPGAGGASRYVDSSVERLQIKVRGMTDSRHTITCNGRLVPLHPTGTVGEFVAGVRYRAWQPPSCLHPTIAVHTPLVFDVVDTWNGRSIGGCTYHVAHPGGRAYETFPVNAYEAESRRVNRFFQFGHTPGPMSVAPAEPNPQFPLTLDLRHGEPTS